MTLPLLIGLGGTLLHLAILPLLYHLYRQS